MSPQSIGVLWAFGAMLGWGFGDFLLQRASRKFGIWRPTFFICVVGSIVLAPFIGQGFAMLAVPRNVFLLLGATIAMTIASLFYVEALKEGKLAVMEPIASAELPIAAILAVALWGESLTFAAWALIALIFVGTALAATSHHAQLHYHKRLFEKGMLFATTAALCNAIVSLLIGASAQKAGALFTVWFVWTLQGLIMLAIIFWRGEGKMLRRDLVAAPRTLFAVGALATCGWIAFALASTRISIAIATAIGESYIIIAIILGLFVSHERLKPHQKIAAAFVALGIIALAWITG